MYNHTLCGCRTLCDTRTAERCMSYVTDRQVGGYAVTGHCGLILSLLSHWESHVLSRATCHASSYRIAIPIPQLVGQTI